MPMLGEILLDKGMITQGQVDACSAKQFGRDPKRFGDLLVEISACSRGDVEQACAEQMNIAVIDTHAFEVEENVLAMVPTQSCVQHQIVPMWIENGVLFIAFYDVSVDKFFPALDDLRFICNCAVEGVFASQEFVQGILKTHYDPMRNELDEFSRDPSKDLVILSEESGDASETPENDAVMNNLIYKIVSRAHELRASDIHFEPFAAIRTKPDNARVFGKVSIGEAKKNAEERAAREKVKKLRIRFRVDGDLEEMVPQIPGNLHANLTGAMKIKAKMKMEDHRHPQDGGIGLELEVKSEKPIEYGGVMAKLVTPGQTKRKKRYKHIDLRASLLPASHGESMVLRILDRDNLKVGVEGLGLIDEDLKLYNSLIYSGSGLILITGPTGSGKTTTLYATLMKRNTIDCKIITLENPVEYTIPGINQVEIRKTGKEETSMTFEKGIKAILRQAPNVILIGEIRDDESAQAAMTMSATGHLVFSTLHTTDAPGASTRLTDMGIAPFVIASNLKAVIAQRLVRMLCPDCKQPQRDGGAIAQLQGLGITGETFAPGNNRSCLTCKGKGFKGRKGIYEIMVISKELQRLISKKSTTDEIRAQALRDGMKTLMQDGLRKIALGLTTLPEVAKEAMHRD